jgi:DNA-binding CsgD family transcriptional regulator/PAS domain-containing protein
MRADIKLSDDKLFALIRLIYETAEDASLWNVLLKRLADTLGASVATLDLYDLAKKQGDVQACINISPEFTEKYRLYFSAKNLWLQYRQDLVIPGRPVLGQMLVSDELMLKSEFYQDFLRHEGIFHLTGLRLLEKGSLAAHLSLMRPRQSEPFDTTVLSFLDVLVPHLQQAMRLHQRIIDAEACGCSLAEALDRMPVGVILVDSSAHVLVMNKAASEIVRAKDGLTVGPDGLEAACHRETVALRDLIAAASAMTGNHGLPPGGTLLISRPSLARSFTVQVIPLSARSHSFGVSRPATAIFASDPEARPTVSHLMSLYHLTPAEEAVALRLVQGQSLAEAAEELGITLNTVRTHLKRIFLKTGTQRQADLMRILLLGVTGLRPA